MRPQTILTGSEDGGMEYYANEKFETLNMKNQNRKI